MPFSFGVEESFKGYIRMIEFFILDHIDIAPETVLVD